MEQVPRIPKPIQMPMTKIHTIYLYAITHQKTIVRYNQGFLEELDRFN